jgi:hypothetical protein
MRKSMTHASALGFALGVLTGCNPGTIGDDDGHPAGDVAWLIDHFARAGDCNEDHITFCISAYYYEYEFRADGTLQSYEVRCRIRQPPDPESVGRWQPTDKFGVVDILPPAGAQSFKMPQANVEHGSVTLTDDCQIVELRHEVGAAAGVPLYRGEFHYEPSGDCTARALYSPDNQPPECPESQL